MPTNAEMVMKPWLRDGSEEWCDFTVEIMNKVNWDLPDDWRLGQKVFNALLEVRRDLAELARGAIWDPFYRDDVLPEFWDKIYDLFILTMDDSRKGST